MIDALIVDDEDNSRQTLSNMLEKYCTGVNVIGKAPSVKVARTIIEDKSPDVVFLDIEMPIENGFKLLEYYEQPDFDVVFTTAYDQYAVKAFKFSAVDYLLKPIDLEELRDAVEKVKSNKAGSKKPQYETLQYNINNNLKKLALPTLEGYSFIDLEEILYCEASNNYTIVYSTSGKKVIVSKTLREYEDLLTDFNFFRVNRSHLINLSYILEYKKGRRPIIVMNNKTEVSLASSRKKEFLDKLSRIY